MKILYRQNTLSHKSSPETEQKTIHAQARRPDAGFEFTLNVCIKQRKATSCSRTSFKPTFLLSSMNPQYELFCVSAQSHATQVSASGREEGCNFHMCGILLLFVVEWKKASCTKWLWHIQHHTVALHMGILSEAMRAPRSKRIVTDPFILSIDGKMKFKLQNRTVLPESLICGHTQPVCTMLLVHAKKKAEKGLYLLELLCSTVKFTYSSIHISLKKLSKSSPLQMFP